MVPAAVTLPIFLITSMQGKGNGAILRNRDHRENATLKWIQISKKKAAVHKKFL